MYVHLYKQNGNDMIHLTLTKSNNEYGDGKTVCGSAIKKTSYSYKVEDFERAIKSGVCKKCAEYYEKKIKKIPGAPLP